MSQRTLRRAAERQARKVERKQQPASPCAATAPAEVAAAAPLTMQPPPEPKSATVAQIAANRQNSQLSSGPKSPEGKAAVAQNRRSHGLAGRFLVLTWENAEDFQSLAQSVYSEHLPETDTEQRLADSLIQHYWLTQRALRLQEQLIASSADPTAVDGNKLSLFLRYQTTHERSYYKAERELKLLKQERGKREIGFESQTRKQEAHQAQVRLAHARALNLEVEAACRKVMEAPIPGNTTIPFEDLAKACSNAIAAVVLQKEHAAAA
jgi:hypothetical protein